MPAEEQEVESKQVKPIMLHRLRSSMSVRHGTLTSDQMRRISNEGIPAICRDTLIDQAVAGLSWEILNSEGGQDANTEFYTMLLHRANTGRGAGTFFASLADDILTTLEGGFYEIVATDDGVPIALYNVDATTMRYRPTDSEYPWEQVFENETPVKFKFNEMAHTLWHPFTDIQAPHLNRTPVQLAYFYISILAAGDDWNYDLLSDPFPAGIFAFPGATEEETEAFKHAWDFAIHGGKLRDIACIYGLDLKQAQHIKVTRPATDMAFEITNHWYSSLIAASYEMSILDISVLTKVSTKAGAESQERQSAQQGQRKLRKLLEESVETNMLPDGYNFRWIVPKPEDEETQAASAERRARATFYYIQALGPEVGYEVAVNEGLIQPDKKPQRSAHVKSLVTKADLAGAMPLDDWESMQDILSLRAELPPRPPKGIWGEELYEWALKAYDRELVIAFELWEVETEIDPTDAIQMFQRRYQDALKRASHRVYVAGKQEELARDAKEAAAIALIALTAMELVWIANILQRDQSYFRRFVQTLREEGLDYVRGKWRVGLYPRAIRKLYDMGRIGTADPSTDMLEISPGVVKTDHCAVCPTHWGLMTISEYEALGGHTSEWCLGFNNCKCITTIRRGARI